MGFASSWSNSVFYHFCTLLSVILSLWLAASVASSCLPDQRFVLLQLKKGFSHSDLPYWLPDTDCCHGWEGVSCDVSGHVTALDLNNRNIEGNLGLCGAPLSKHCNVNSENNSTTLSTSSVEEKFAIVLLCLFIGLGIGLGFSIVIVWPIIKRVIKGWGTR